MIGDFAEVGVLPEVAHFVRAFDADVAPLGGDLGRGIAAIEECDCVAPIGQRFGPDFEGAFLGNANALFAELVLIDGDDRGDAAAKVTAKWSDIGVKGSHKVRDLCKHADLGKVADQYAAEVPSHGVVMIKIAK